MSGNPSRSWDLATAAVVTALVPVALASPVIGPATAQAASVAPSATTTPCQPGPVDRSLPVWARAGFHPPDTPMPHVLGHRGLIVAILWASPRALFAPPSPRLNNKILWVSRTPGVPGAPLHITARQVVGNKLVGAAQSQVVLGGPGPSTVNMPAAGCWQFDLKWSGQKDSLFLQYYR